MAIDKKSKETSSRLANTLSEGEFKSSKVHITPGMILLIIGVLSILLALLQGNSLNWNPNYVGGYFLFVYIFMSIGIILIIIGIILVFNKKIIDKKVNSVSQSDLVKIFACPESGNKGAVYLIKLVKDRIIVEQSCLPNGTRRVTIPLRLKDQCFPYFQDKVFRCFKCGKQATVDHIKPSGPWTWIKLSCPIHGNELPYHKIWSTVYSDISDGVDNKP